MDNEPGASAPSDLSGLGEAAHVERRDVNTQGGDYAEGGIDKRQSVFVDGHFTGATLNITPAIYQVSRETPPAFQIPCQPIPLIGRDAALAELAELLTGDAPVAVSPAVVGMGGVGKTLPAATFAHRYQAHFAHFPGGVFWLNMEQPGLIAAQVADCAGPGGPDLPDHAAGSFEERIACVQAAWNSSVRRLLVFDNLEEPSLLRRWQPTGSGACVLITTRRDDWLRQVQRLRLPTLLRPHSIELLLGARASDQGVAVEQLLASNAERTAADAICDLLGDLSLALAIAAALQLNPSLRLHEFHARIPADPLFTAADTTTMQEILREADLPTGRERGIAATFAISYRQLCPDDAVDALALRALHAAAYCAPAPIPQEALWRLAGLDPASVEGRQAGNAVIRRLRALGLVETSNENGAGVITLHRLLAAFVRQQPHPPEALGATAAALANHASALQNAGQSLALVPHLESVPTHRADALGAEHPDTLSTAHSLAVRLAEQGYAAARARYEAVLDARTRVLSAEHPDTLSAAYNLATTLEHIGRWQDAARLHA